MNGLKIKRTIELSYSWRDWQLYDMPLVGLVAQDLNHAVEIAVNAEGSTRSTVTAAFLKKAREHEKFGTTDTEPLYVLDDIIKAVYGDIV